MTKEQIIKHKEVIKWFRDNPDKGVWFKDINRGWVLITQPSFNPHYIYVQNDKYAKYRKALADGKTIKCRRKNGDIWEKVTANIEPTRNFNSLYRYRIKKDKPKFKVGDWVIHHFGDKKQIIKITNMCKSTSSDLILYYKDGCFIYDKKILKNGNQKRMNGVCFGTIIIKSILLPNTIHSIRITILDYLN